MRVQLPVCHKREEEEADGEKLDIKPNKQDKKSKKKVKSSALKTKHVAQPKTRKRLAADTSATDESMNFSGAGEASETTLQTASKVKAAKTKKRKTTTDPTATKKEKKKSKFPQVKSVLSILEEVAGRSEQLQREMEDKEVRVCVYA